MNSLLSFRLASRLFTSSRGGRITANEGMLAATSVSVD